LLKDQKPLVRKTTTEVLERFGPQAVVVLTEMLASLEDADEQVDLSGGDGGLACR
jgi:hypothetical protein